MYTVIKDEDLIAKEFKYHEYCYIKFTRGFGNSAKDSNITSPDSTNVYSKGDFNKVKLMIKNEVLMNGRAISMNVLHSAYGLCESDTRYRNKLKQRIVKQFDTEILFLPSVENNSEVIVSKEAIQHDTLWKKEDNIKIVAKQLKEDIKKHYSAQNENSFPVFHEQVVQLEKKLPESVLQFLENLLKSEGHSLESQPKISRICSSIAQDLVHAVMRGKHLTEKHFLLGLGLHNLTEQKV